MFSMFRLFVILVVSHIGFEDRTLDLIASVPGHCLHFTFLNGDVKLMITDKTKSYNMCGHQDL